MNKDLYSEKTTVMSRGVKNRLFPDLAGLKVLAANHKMAKHLQFLVFLLFLWFSTVHPWFCALFDLHDCLS